MRPAVVLACVGLVALAGGCFFTAPVNERPSADILGTIGEVHRGDEVHLGSNVYDPDGDSTTVTWRVHRCAATCSPFVDTFATEDLDYVVPYTTLDTGELVRHLRFELVVEDRWGAAARPVRTLNVDVSNVDPTSDGVIASWHGVGERFPVGVPIRIEVSKQDLDTPEANVQVRPSLFRDGAAEDAGALIARPDESTRAVAVYTFQPEQVGSWRLVFDLVDSEGGVEPVEKTLQIVADQHPCLRSVVPRFAGPLAVDAPRRFTVLTVDDDKDVWPASDADDGVTGTARFRWFLSSPDDAEAFAPIDGNEGAELVIDPARFAPGDVFEVRVDALDRVEREACDPTNRTCSQREDGCTRRMTWKVQIR